MPDAAQSPVDRGVLGFDDRAELLDAPVQDRALLSQRGKLGTRHRDHRLVHPHALCDSARSVKVCGDGADGLELLHIGRRERALEGPDVKVYGRLRPGLDRKGGSGPRANLKAAASASEGVLVHARGSLDCR